MKKQTLNHQILLKAEELEERIAPSVEGTGGYDGQPGNQANSHGNPSGSANPEGTANPENSESGPKQGAG
ncbi:MAG TPA: hypothetical protein VFU05_02890 [Cyclobacteriaceae bacterium]|nr:hypothetical protein [Cyclobacteriaceae bacterium]